jgi:putative ABC transport system permease protein
VQEVLSQPNLVAPADFLDLRRETRVLERMAAFRLTKMTLAGNDEAVRIVVTEATADFFTTLGVTTAQGRAFASDEDQPGRDRVAVISDRFWRERLGANPAVRDSLLQLNGRSYSVIGILPPGVVYPPAVDVWVPLALTPQQQQERTAQTVRVVARMRSDSSPPQVQEDLTKVAQRLEARYPETNRGRGFNQLPLRQEQYELTAPLFLLVQGAAVFVLLIACVNVGGLFFARGVARRKEIAVRQALGAGGGRLTALLMTEALVLAFVAGALGVVLAFWGVDLIRSGIPSDVSKWVAGWDSIHVDPTVLGFAAAITLLAGLGFGLAAGRQASRTPAIAALREGWDAPGRQGQRLLRALIVAEVGLSLVLLAGAGLLLQGFRQTLEGYRAMDLASVLSLQLALPESRYSSDAEVARFYDRLLEQIRILPGVKAAGAIRNRPVRNVANPRQALTLEGRPALSVADTPQVDVQVAGAGYFDALHIPVAEGRSIDLRDSADSPRVAIISRSLARRYWPDRSPLQARLKLGLPDSAAPWITVVGVVGDVKQNWYDPQPRPTVYLPYPQSASRIMFLTIRAAGDPRTLAAPVSALVRQADPGVPIESMNAMESQVVEDLSPVRVIGMLMLVFGGVALLLASVGIYGTLAYSVEQRTHEFGVRLALGASPADVWKLVLGQAGKLAGIGLAIGMPAAWALGQVLSSRLFGLLRLDWPILGGAAAGLALVAFAAGMAPALRAMRVPPIAVLRCQ